MAGRALVAIICGAILLHGCATVRQDSPGSELVGRTLRMQTPRGEVTSLQFRADGTVRATFQRGSAVGQWQARRRSLCFMWTGAPRECWPYEDRFVRGRTRTITSDRGNVLRVTML